MLFTGNLARYQGIELLLQAFAQVIRLKPDVRLVIAANDSFEPYEPLARELGVRASIDLLPAPEFDRLPTILAGADVMVNPRTECDGLPVKLLNYMAASKPVVSFAAAAPGVEHRRTGWLVADADATAFAEGILTLLDDPELADELGRGARRYVEANCRWPAIAERVQAVYETTARSCPVSAPRRLSICYVVPGHSLVATAGPTRNVLNLARALGQWADVTVAFRLAIDAQDRTTFAWSRSRLIALGTVHAADDAAVRGVGYAEFLGYLRQLRRFAAERLLSYDVVLEKSWLLSGYLSSYCRRRGVLGVPVENVVPNPGHVARGNLTKFARLQVGRWLAGRYLRKAPLIIAETEFLKADIAANWRVAPERIAVVDLGVDRALFRPLDQAAARRSLGIAPDKTVLLYVGVLDDIHDLGPLLEAMSVGAGPDDRAPPGRGWPLCRPLPGEGRRRRERRLPRPRGALSGARADRRCRPLRRPL